MPNVELHPYSRPAMWRRMALACWTHPNDPQVYARMDADMTAALAYAAEASGASGVRLAPVHLVIRGLALALRAYPEANAMVRLRRVYSRKRVNIFCQVALPGRRPDLSGAVLRDADTLTPVEIARQLKAKVDDLRGGRDRDLQHARRLLDRCPTPLYRALLRGIDLLRCTLNLNLGRFGVPQDAFGGAMVTSVGSLGIAEAFAPLVPLTRAPIIVSVGSVEDRPAVCEGRLAIRPACTLCVTFDHRIMDGLLAARLSRFLKRYLADPAAGERRGARRALSGEQQVQDAGDGG
jgi:pyruvate/2-oxoglutarate dehydrogenase complex dihydrolipoamide acyltransferase (E2) component